MQESDVNDAPIIVSSEARLAQQHALDLLRGAGARLRERIAQRNHQHTVKEKWVSKFSSVNGSNTPKRGKTDDT